MKSPPAIRSSPVPPAEQHVAVTDKDLNAKNLTATSAANR
jgi:hypothetical protein